MAASTGSDAPQSPTSPTSLDYAALVPPPHRRAAGAEPVSTWWSWRGYRVHVARAPRPQAPVRVVAVHGVAGHSAALWPLAALLASRGLEVAALDLPLYGATTCPEPGAVRYGDWVDLLADFVATEDDGRPVILFGASMGGLLAYQAAHRSAAVDAVAATCLLDPRDRRVATQLTRFGSLGLLALPLSVLVRGRLGEVMIPVRRVADLTRISRDPRMARLCASDPRGGGALVPLGFLASYLRYRHTVAARTRTPLLLVHPTHDAWTPVELSMRFLRRIAAPSTVVLLRECGHFPIEEPGITDLLDAIDRLAAGLRPE
ncbi:MAG: alpha/beta hydrolase [Propioniciclava sp.]|uniref:alpha/beta hydrolase n=1 Tax=Propioniciclava sp. TaxID=2038686 RepID=UPI0039E3657D